MFEVAVENKLLAEVLSGRHNDLRGYFIIFFNYAHQGQHANDNNYIWCFIVITTYNDYNMLMIILGASENSVSHLSRSFKATQLL